MKHITYGPGGWLPGEANENVIEIRDDETRIVTDYSSGEPVERPYTDEENALVDALA